MNNNMTNTGPTQQHIDYMKVALTSKIHYAMK